MPKVLVIVGPTASGKSDLAVKLAKKFKSEVISADSRQVYKGLDIGTGKITKKEMQGVPHHLLDVADPKMQFSVAEYKTLALNSLRYIVAKKKLPIIVGGTGFYIDAVTGAATLPEVPPNKKLRNKLEKKSAEALFKMLEKKDPARAKTIDRHNKVRLVRALEIVEALGKVPTRQPATLTDYEFVYIGLKPEWSDLEKRIYARLTKRLPSMIKEAKALNKNGLSWKRMGQVGIEYLYLSKYLQGKITKEALIESIYKDSKAYAKRQYTWFKRNKKIRWFDPKKTKLKDYMDHCGR